jgi:hypothetical protein
VDLAMLDATEALELLRQRRPAEAGAVLAGIPQVASLELERRLSSIRRALTGATSPE